MKIRFELDDDLPLGKTVLVFQVLGRRSSDNER